MDIRVKVKNKQELQRALLYKIGRAVVQKAVRLAPVDMGHLRQSIKIISITDTEVTIGTQGVDYADKMEYGSPPEPMSAEEREAIKGWVHRHATSFNIPSGDKKAEAAVARNVANKIEREGIKAGSPENPMLMPNGTYRPFLRPALHQTMPEIKAMVKEAFK